MCIFISVTVGGITANRAADNVFTRRGSFTFIVEFNLLLVLARGLGFKVNGRVEKQDCNEQ